MAEAGKDVRSLREDTNPKDAQPNHIQPRSEGGITDRTIAKYTAFNAIRPNPTGNENSKTTKAENRKEFDMTIGNGASPSHSAMLGREF